MILCSPFSGTFGQREIFIGNNLLDTGRYQVRAHIGEIGISSIVIFEAVSCIFQATGDGRKFVRLFGIFHDAGARLSGISADDRCQSAVCAETAAVEVAE